MSASLCFFLKKKRKKEAKAVHVWLRCLFVMSRREPISTYPLKITHFGPTSSRPPFQTQFATWIWKQRAENSSLFFVLFVVVCIQGRFSCESLLHCSREGQEKKQRCAVWRDVGPLKFSFFIIFFFNISSSLAVRLLNQRLVWPQTQLPNGATRRSTVVFHRRCGVTFLFVGIH